MTVLADVVGQYEEAESVAQNVLSLLKSTPQVHPPLRWGAALLPLEFALMHGRIRAECQDWLGAVSALWRGIKWDLESVIARQARAERSVAGLVTGLRRYEGGGFACGAEQWWEDEARRSSLRQTIKIELAFLLVRYLSDHAAIENAHSTAQRLLLEVLEENKDNVLAKVTLSLALCYPCLVAAAKQMREFSNFAHRTCPPLLSLDTPLIGAHAEGARRAGRPTLRTAQELLEESVAEMQLREHLHHDGHDRHGHAHGTGHHGLEERKRSREETARIRAEQYAPWVLPKREHLPPHLLSQALLFLGHLRRHMQGPEAARVSCPGSLTHSLSLFSLSL
jgi:hypothetical protein